MLKHAVKHSVIGLELTLILNPVFQFSFTLHSHKLTLPFPPSHLPDSTINHPLGLSDMPLDVARPQAHEYRRAVVEEIGRSEELSQRAVMEAEDALVNQGNATLASIWLELQRVRADGSVCFLFFCPCYSDCCFFFGQLGSGYGSGAGAESE